MRRQTETGRKIFAGNTAVAILAARCQEHAAITTRVSDFGTTCHSRHGRLDCLNGLAE